MVTSKLSTSLSKLLMATTSAICVSACGSGSSSSQGTVVVVPTTITQTSDAATALGGLATAPTPSPTPTPTAAAAKALPGVNLSGGEFGTVPGTMFTNYTYPTNAEIDYFVQKGFKVVRVPFRWQRLQPVINGELSATDRSALKKVVTYANSRDLTVILDMHDFAARKIGTTTYKVGSSQLPASALLDAWARIGADYVGNDKVWIGLMNEPSAIEIAEWWKAAQEVVIGLRGRSIRNKVLVPGASWTAAYNWAKSGNAASAETFSDPINNFAFEIHQYFDSDSSGTHAECTKGAAARIDGVLQWAAARKVRLFVGEMGASSDPQCAIEYPAVLQKLNTSPEVLGWTAWGGGSWWNASYMYRLQPAKGAEGTTTPHMALLQNNLPH